MGLASEVPAQSQPPVAQGESKVHFPSEKALVLQDTPDPVIRLTIAETGDTGCVSHMMDARSSIEAARSDLGFNCGHACAVVGFEDIAEMLLKRKCNPQYLDALMPPNGATPVWVASQNGHYDLMISHRFIWCQNSPTMML